MKYATLVLGILLCSFSAFAVTLGNGAIEGVLVDEKGAPAAHVLVTAATADQEIFFVTRTDAMGRFVFSKVPVARSVMIVASRDVTAGAQMKRVTIDVDASKTTRVNLSFGAPLANLCSCGCPWDPEKIWSIDIGDCSNCPSCKL